MPEPIPLAPLSALENPDIPPTMFPLARLAIPVPIPPTIPTALFTSGSYLITYISQCCRFASDGRKWNIYFE